MAASGTVHIRITADTSELERALGRVERKTKRVVWRLRWRRFRERLGI